MLDEVIITQTSGQDVKCMSKFFHYGLFHLLANYKTISIQVPLIQKCKRNQKLVMNQIKTKHNNI